MSAVSFFFKKKKKKTASISLVPTWTSLTSGRALQCCEKNAFNSMCLVLRVDPLRLIIPSAAEESQHRICCVVSLVSSALHPNFNNQSLCCRKLMPSQAPESAATSSASPLLSVIVDCFLFDAVIGYQPSLLRNPDALNRSVSPAQSESPYINTEPTGALFTASRVSVVGRTVMIPGFPRMYRRINLMFLMSVSLARPRLDEAFPVAQRKSARPVFQHAVGRLFVPLQESLSHLSHGVPSAVLVSSCGHVELFQHAFHIRGINFQKLYPPFLPKFVPSRALVFFCRHLAALELQVSTQSSEDFLDDLARSSQQQVVHVEYE